VTCPRIVPSGTEEIDLEIRVGDFMIQPYPFKIERTQPMALDVSGEIGLSPSSVLAESIRIRVRREMFDIASTRSQQEAISFLPLDPSFEISQYAQIPISGTDTWLTYADMYLNGILLDKVRSPNIIFNPSRDYVEIPIQFEDTIRSILHGNIFVEDRDGILHIPCSTPPLLFSFIPTTSKDLSHIPIYSRRDVSGRRTIDGVQYCATEFRFTRPTVNQNVPGMDRHTWVIGKPILNDRDGIILDGSNGKIYVSNNPWSKDDMYRSPTQIPNAPTFNIPRFTGQYIIEPIDDSLTYIRFLSAPHQSSGGYILRSTEPIQGYADQSSYSFICSPIGSCSSAIDHSISPVHTLDGLYHVYTSDHKMIYDSVSGDVIVAITKAVNPALPIYTIRLMKTASNILVSLLPEEVEVVPGDLDLPPPVVKPLAVAEEEPTSSTTRAESPTVRSAESPISVTNDLEDDDTCCICLCQMVGGDSVQTLPGSCVHRFHEECIQRWFNTGKAHCPLCKLNVPFKPGTNLRRIEENPWEDHVEGLLDLLDDLFNPRDDDA